jgi:hypothetical protein
MENREISPTAAADLSASYLRTAKEGEEQIEANILQRDKLFQQIGEDARAQSEGEYDPALALELFEKAVTIGVQNLQLSYSVENADAGAKILYEHRQGNAALREAALAEAALDGVQINL